MVAIMRRRRDQQEQDGSAVGVLRTLTAAAILLSPCDAQTRPCPSNPVLTGYTSITALNNDIQTEIDRITQGGTPEEEYVFTLCPRHVFEVDEPLLPQLSGSVFQCGVSGLSTDNCVIRGGVEQVRVEDSTIATYPLQDVSFRGLTFESFTNTAEEDGASVNVFASETTTVRFVDVVWAEFDSKFVIRQQSASSTVPASITIDQAMVTNGQAVVVFGADGGSLNIRGLTAASLTADALILAENEAAATLSSSVIQNSDLTSVTDTRTGAIQRVLDSTVSDMRDLEDTFIGTGTNSRVFLTRTTVENNILSDIRWRVLNVRDGAQGRAVETTVTGNTGLQFGFTAASSSSVMLIDDSFFTNNVGLGGDATSAPVITLQGAITSIERTEFNENAMYTSNALAFFRSFLAIQQSCFQETQNTFVVFVDGDSTFSGTLNFVDSDVESEFCPAPGNRLFQEDPGSACFLGGDCEGQCEVLATEESCLANVVDTEEPTAAPAAPTVTPTLAPVVPDAPTSVPVEITPTVSPTDAPTAFPVEVGPTTTPVAVPTTRPTIRGTSAPSPALVPAEDLPTVQPTKCPGAKLVKQPKHKPKTKLSKYARSGSRKKKQKDFYPTQKFYTNEWYNFEDLPAKASSAKPDTDDESKHGYYYFWVCPELKSSKGKGGKGKSMMGMKSSMKSSMKGGSMKGSKKDKSKSGKGKRVLIEDSTGEPRPGLRRYHL